jgi:hypothetical protein
VTYKDHDQLSVMQIINPMWVTKGVYMILRSELIDHHGKLTRGQFERVFANEPKYKTRHYVWLIDLLKQFDLAFDIDTDNDKQKTVLIPSRLDSTEPRFDLNHYEQGLNFCFSYEDILKKNVISRFIVLMHQYVTQEGVKYWQRGGFLTFGEQDPANGVVMADEQKKTITIAIDKANRHGRELLTIIRHTIRKINAGMVAVDEQVPLLADGVLCGFKSFDDIVDAEQQKITTLRCRVNLADEKHRTYNVAELLDGYRIKDDTEFDYQPFERHFISVCAKLTERNQAIFDENEDQTTDRFSDLLGQSYRVCDQSRGGRSVSGLSAGERDLVVRNDQTDVAEVIIEAFVLKKYDHKVLSEHCHKLIHHYDTVGNRNNIAVCYAKTADFYRLWQKYQDCFEDFEDNTNEQSKTKVLVGKTRHGEGKFRRDVTHVMVNFFPGELS